ncbi:hypothetical protein C0J52_10802 [Blattella germanica]|nr:hypothetical protein C0J52_10802 [Blattella germanica]
MIKSREPKSREPKSRQPKSRQGASKSSTTSCNPKKENPTDPENVKSNPAVPEPRSGDVMPTANAKVEGPQECHQKLEKIKPKRSQTAIDPWKGVCVICPAEYARRKRHNNPEFAVSSDKSANASGTCDEVVDQTSGEELIQALSSERHEWMDPLPDSVINELIIDYLSD